jgi:hypothetical protein
VSAKEEEPPLAGVGERRFFQMLQVTGLALMVVTPACHVTTCAGSASVHVGMHAAGRDLASHPTIRLAVQTVGLTVQRAVPGLAAQFANLSSFTERAFPQPAFAFSTDGETTFALFALGEAGASLSPNERALASFAFPHHNGRTATEIPSMPAEGSAPA